MNVWQVAKQLRYILRSADWPGNGDPVFGAVHVTNGLAEEEYALLKMPGCLISIGDSVSDAEDPDYVIQNFMVSWMCQVAGDVRGESPLLGASRPSGNTSSRGRGVLEIEEEVSRALRQMQDSVGVRLLGRRRSTPEVGLFSDFGYVALRSMMVEVKCTDARYYHPPRDVVATAGGGNVTVTWTDPPDRYDRRRLRLRRSNSATPPSDESSGTDLGFVALGVNTYLDVAPGAGTWSYAVFASYTDTGAAEDQRYSEGYLTEEGVSDSVTL